MQTKSYNLLKKPLSHEQQKKAKGCHVCGVIEIELTEIIDLDREALTDLLSTRLIGGVLLMDISYKIAGHNKDTLHMEVSGNAQGSLECSA